jgi:hypothetical protein
MAFGPTGYCQNAKDMADRGRSRHAGGTKLLCTAATTRRRGLIHGPSPTFRSCAIASAQSTGLCPAVSPCDYRSNGTGQDTHLGYIPSRLNREERIKKAAMDAPRIPRATRTVPA